MNFYRPRFAFFSLIFLSGFLAVAAPSPRLVMVLNGTEYAVNLIQANSTEGQYFGDEENLSLNLFVKSADGVEKISIRATDAKGRELCDATLDIPQQAGFKTGGRSPKLSLICGRSTVTLLER